MARLVGPAAAPDGATAPMENGQGHATLAGNRDHVGLRLMEHPGGGQEPRLLVRIRVPEHDLLPLGASRAALAIDRVIEERGDDRPRSLQRLRGLEQGDDVEVGWVAFGARVRHRVPGQLEDVRDVRRLRRETHDVPPAALYPEPCLDRGDRAERGEDFAQRDAGRDLRGLREAVPDGLERRAVHPRVLADLERGQVEAECAELPAEFRYLTPGDALEPILDERILDLDEFRVELSRVAVATTQRRGFTGQRRPSAAEPLCDEPEPLPIRLVREAPPQLPIRLGQVLGIARQPGHDLTRDPVGRDGGRERLHMPRRDGFVPAQDVVGLDPKRLLGCFRGDLRVPVPIAADPAPPVEER